ncbi:MAG: hypothetical protein Q8R60_15150 [Mycobacteriales bacterium]|nr:hypothetical protein [Mycobacteriales bacterium]
MTGVGRRTRSGLAVVAVLALVAGTAVGLLHLRRADHEQESRDAALSAARRAATAFTSYDKADLDASFAAVLTLATPRFREQFTEAGEQLRPLIASKQASAKGTVLAAGMERWEDDAARASVLVAADAVVTNVDFPKGASQRFRLRVELRRLDDRWLVDAITPVV